jgi:hypothetical protein
MSLGIVIKGPGGLVLAAESRVTLEAQRGDERLRVNFDNTTKLLSFSDPNDDIAVVTYGQAAIGLRTAHSFVPEFEAQLPDKRLSVSGFAQNLSDFFMAQWQTTMPTDYQGPSMTFVIGGFDEKSEDGEKEPYGKVFLVEIPHKSKPVEQNPGPGQFGITWGGQRDFVDRLIKGYDHRLPGIVASTLGLEFEQIQALEQELVPLQMQIPLAAMPLQDSVDLAIFFLRTTISAQSLTIGIRGCGGPIDVATITRREGLEFVQRKQIAGER